MVFVWVEFCCSVPFVCRNSRICVLFLNFFFPQFILVLRMHSLRGSLSSIPGTLTSIIGSLPTPSSVLSRRQQAAICASSSRSSVSGDELSDRSQAIPSSLITEQWQLVLGMVHFLWTILVIVLDFEKFFQNASVDELENAIDRCKELVIDTEECSNERKWLVRHLVELRFRLNEIQDVIEDPQSQMPNTTVSQLLLRTISLHYVTANIELQVILGHHFVPGKVKNAARQHCDHCSGIIWSVVQASYLCSDCNYCAHHKCIPSIIRVCAHIVASERKEAIEDISPEIGLAMQAYKCAECETPLNYSKFCRASNYLRSG